MNSFETRTYEILQAAIQEFINEGRPVSSRQLAKKYKFGVKDASIRAELNNLTEDGFLSQPHTSGGRVPTDKGYQYIINQTMEHLFNSMDSIISAHINHLINSFLRHEWTNFIDEFAQETKMLGAGYDNKTFGVYKSGLMDLFEQMELNTKNDFYEIVRDFEMLDKKLEQLPYLINNSPGPQIFIGKKSPITQSENLSVIIDGYEIDGTKFYLAAIGPKRMNYEKNLKIFKQIKEVSKKRKM